MKIGNWKLIISKHLTLVRCVNPFDLHALSTPPAFILS